MAPAPSLLCLRGALVIEGKAPDGDSIRLVPDTPDLLGELRRADRIRVSPTDGSVQLRLEAIDAPEVSYGPAGSRSAPRRATGSWSSRGSPTCAARAAAAR